MGLIFLSAMASDIAVICNGAGLPAQDALGTTLFTFSIATMVVGILTMLVGENGRMPSVSTSRFTLNLHCPRFHCPLWTICTVFKQDFFFTGKCRMAQLVQYVPLPVVGGYLGYVGYFCVAGGTSLAAGVEVC